MKTRIILLLLSVLSTQVYASEVGFIVGSRHFDTKEDYNEFNPGVYVIEEGIIKGIYKNSYDDPTIFVGWALGYETESKVRIYLGYGIMYGYGWDNGLASSDKGGRKLLPFILPTMSVKKGKDLYFNMHIVGNAMAWSFSKKFN